MQLVDADELEAWFIGHDKWTSEQVFRLIKSLPVHTIVKLPENAKVTVDISDAVNVTGDVLAHHENHIPEVRKMVEQPDKLAELERRIVELEK